LLYNVETLCYFTHAERLSRDCLDLTELEEDGDQRHTYQPVHFFETMSKTNDVASGSTQSPSVQRNNKRLEKKQNFLLARQVSHYKSVFPSTTKAGPRESQHSPTAAIACSVACNYRRRCGRLVAASRSYAHRRLRSNPSPTTASGTIAYEQSNPRVST